MDLEYEQNMTTLKELKAIVADFVEETQSTDVYKFLLCIECKNEKHKNDDKKYSWSKK